MQTKTIIIIAVLIVLAIGAVVYFSTNIQTKLGIPNDGGSSANAPDLTTSDDVFSEIDNTANSLE